MKDMNVAQLLDRMHKQTPMIDSRETRTEIQHLILHIRKKLGLK